MENTLVSVITPSFNQGRFIEDTILSVKNQDYPDIEHIIVDGGSTDDTLPILRRHEQSYNMKWTSEPDRGQSDALNKGFRKVNGEIIGWINADDVYFSNQVVDYVVKYFKEHSSVDFIYGNFINMDQSGRIYELRPVPRFNYNRLVRWCFIPQAAIFFRQKVAKSYEFNIKQEFVMDHDFFLFVGQNYKMQYVNKNLACFRRHNYSKVHNMGNEIFLREYKQIRKEKGMSKGLSYHLGIFSDKFLKLYLKSKGRLMLLYLRYKKLRVYNFPFIKL